MSVHSARYIVRCTTLCLAVLVSAISCIGPSTAPAGYERTGHVQTVEHDNASLTVVSKSHGDDLAQARYHADVKAFQQLFFEGIPKSNQQIALISKDRQSDDIKMWVSKFMQSGTYLPYVTSRRTINSFEKVDIIMIEEQLTIDIESLRPYLVEKNVIPKMGF